MVMNLNQIKKEVQQRLNNSQQAIVAAIIKQEISSHKFHPYCQCAYCTLTFKYIHAKLTKTFYLRRLDDGYYNDRSLSGYLQAVENIKIINQQRKEIKQQEVNLLT